MKNPLSSKKATKDLKKSSEIKDSKKKTSVKKAAVVSKIKKVSKGSPNMGYAEEVIIDKKIKLKPSKHIVALAVNPLNVYSANSGYKRGKRSETFAFITRVFAALKDNPYFLTTSPDIADIKAEISLYDKSHGKGDSSVSDQHFVNILYMMKQLGIFVSNNCLNSLKIFLSSGFLANQPNTRLNLEMGRVRVKSVKDTKRSGEAKLTVHKMAGAMFYEGQYQEVYLDETTGKESYGAMITIDAKVGIKMLFESLPIGKRVLLYARACGAKNKGDWSIGFPWIPR